MSLNRNERERERERERDRQTDRQTDRVAITSENIMKKSHSKSQY